MDIWLLIIIVTIIIELLTIDLVSIWFSIGALVALIGAYFQLDVTIQIFLFVSISTICIIFTRPIAKRYLRANTVATNYDRTIGKKGIVTETISPNQKGRVTVLMVSWAASSLDDQEIPKGSEVSVLAIEGSHLIVKKI